jgi:hypothetical protein
MKSGIAFLQNGISERDDQQRGQRHAPVAADAQRQEKLPRSLLIQISVVIVLSIK